MTKRNNLPDKVAKEIQDVILSEYPNGNKLTAIHRANFINYKAGMNRGAHIMMNYSDAIIEKKDAMIAEYEASIQGYREVLDKLTARMPDVKNKD